jgi:hypothetical protein
MCGTRAHCLIDGDRNGGRKHRKTRKESASQDAKGRRLMRTIFLIRHAEKPPDKRRKHPGREPQKHLAHKRQKDGVDETGAPDDEALTVPGWQRAGALAVFFGSKKGLPAPDRIYASAGKKKVAPRVLLGSDSERPALTVSPLAAKLGLKVIRTFTKGQEAGLADEIAKQKGITLVCWQHQKIPKIAKTILGSTAGVPRGWPSTRFDVVWCFVRGRKRKRWMFGQRCQNLLAGDKSHPIPLKGTTRRRRTPRRPRG